MCIEKCFDINSGKISKNIINILSLCTYKIVLFILLNYIRNNNNMESKFPEQENRQKQMCFEKLLLKGKRRSKRAEVKQSFSCQCGKIYLSFSALYLHAKNKHNFKLTTKLSDEVCRVDRSQGLIKYTYYILQIEKGDHSKLSQSQRRDSIIQELGERNENKSLGVEEELSSLKCFQAYFYKIKSKKENETVKEFLRFVIDAKQRNSQKILQAIKEMPNFLNDFMLNYIPKITNLAVNSLQWKQMCNFLDNFCKWLHQNKMTDLIVINDVKSFDA